MSDFYRAIPLDEHSHQQGDVNWKELKDKNESAEFKVKYVSAGSTPKIIFTVKKNGTETEFPFSATAQSGSIAVTVSKTDIATIYAAANGGNWDYVKFAGVATAFNNGGTSELSIEQDGSTYDNTDWPPHTT